MLRFLSFFWDKRKDHRSRQEDDVFKEKYGYFKNLLLKNNEALDLLTDLEQLVYESRSFTLDSFIGKVEELIGVVYEEAEYLNGQTLGAYSELFDQAENLGIKILSGLVKKKEIRKSHLVLPLRSLSLDRLSEVGGKSANLGEVANRVNLPTPQGFALTAYACHHFLTTNNLWDEVASDIANLDIHDTELLVRVCEDIQARITAAKVPPDITKAMRSAAAALEAEFGPDLRFSVRSSATGEDSEASFAGQHSSVLNVSEDDLEAAYKEVVASTYGPRAVFYARSKGYSHNDLIMAVLCVAMIESKASGVAYTIDPNHPDEKNIMISAAWGLGVSVVDGSTPADEYRVAKKTRTVISRAIAEKEELLASSDGPGLDLKPVPADLQKAACLSDVQVIQLADYAIRLEKHYGFPLDIEWALDDKDRLFILQARALNPQPEAGEASEEPTPVPDYSILVRGGATASRGTAAGKAYLLGSEHHLMSVPPGAILVARKTSPYYVPIIGRIAAIVTDIGSVTGHMASVAREFGVPALVGLPQATRLIEHGRGITVDATNRIIYSGTVTQILREKSGVNLMKGSPTLLAVREALKSISPLNLVDPKNENFTPEGCETLHDLIRFIHEKSMRDMFKISDDLDESEHEAILLKVKLPLRIFMVDLGGGLSPDHGTNSVSPEEVTSVPFLAVLKGMTHEKVQWLGSVGISFKGFASVMAESILQDPMADGRFGGPSYAVIADEYLNFNTRLGYHFATVDTFCGQNINANYITFFFKGGAADIARRARRAALIGSILKRLDFRVESRGDMVRAELKKVEFERIQDRLDQLGRLMGAVRLLDMVLSDEGQVQWYVEEFFKGNYSFRKEG
jgi:pyruvate, water dikinase